MIKLTILIVILVVFASFTMVYAATCKDAGLSYSSSSVCFSKDKEQATKQTMQPTTLKLFDMKNPFNEGSPIVFVGKLVTKSGEPVPDAKITIKHDGLCTNKTIGSGKTDKTGRFWIYAIAKVWDKKDNLVKTHAEFTGKTGFLASTSEYKIIVVYPVQNKGC
jgi:uncharacterized GH25 family protein